jgi:hypothetical protein
MIRRYGLGWTLLVLFLASAAGHFALVLGRGEDFATWLASTLENWQSEFLQLALQVVLPTFLLHVGSPTSKEASERLEAKVDQLLIHTVRDGDEIVRILDDAHLRK